MKTEAYGAFRVERKKFETLLGEVKYILALARRRLRGLSGARDDFLLVATAPTKRFVAHACTLDAIGPEKHAASAKSRLGGKVVQSQFLPTIG